MAKNRGWFCTVCNKMVVKIGKGFRIAHEKHKKECEGNSKGLLCTYRIKNT